MQYTPYFIAWVFINALSLSHSFVWLVGCSSFVQGKRKGINRIKYTTEFRFEIHRTHNVYFIFAFCCAFVILMLRYLVLLLGTLCALLFCSALLCSVRFGSVLFNSVQFSSLYVRQSHSLPLPLLSLRCYAIIDIHIL